MWGAVEGGGWVPVLGEGYWSISEKQKPGKKQRSGLPLHLHADQEAKDFWRLVLERPMVVEQLEQNLGFLAVLGVDLPV